MKKLLLFLPIALFIHTLRAQQEADFAVFKNFKTHYSAREFLIKSLPLEKDIPAFIKAEYVDSVSKQILNYGQWVKNLKQLDSEISFNGSEVFHINEGKSDNPAFDGSMESFLKYFKDGIVLYKFNYKKPEDRETRYYYWTFINKQWLFIGTPYRK